jgi:hypothetical protein
MTYQNGFLAYTFQLNGNTYGQKIKLPARGVMDIASVTMQLALNAVETYDAITK